MNESIYKDFTILCIEDEDGVRRRVVNTLSYYFAQVLEASDGQVGFQMYQKYVPDIILCDIQMPKLNGVEFVKKVRAEDAKTPIVILTAYSSEDYLLELINLHIQHFILKPISSQKLLEGIDKALSEKSSSKIRLCDKLFLDTKNNTLYSKEKSINLTQRETNFLSLLAESKDHILYYSRIEEELWRDKRMSQNALKSFVRDLRKKLFFDIIQNVSQSGYRLTCKNI
jgi:two-component system, OmpR family, response regulator VanR